MTDPRQLEKLLGGYATGTLTEEERQALFQAALEHQELFDALLGEQPLRDSLEDPAARARLLTAVQERRPAWRRRWPWPLVLAPTLVGIAAAFIGFVITRTMPPPPPPIRAGLKPPAPQAEGLLRHAAATSRLALTYSVQHPAGDSSGAIALRFIPNDDGFIYISDGSRLIAASPVERLKPYTTPPLDHTGGWFYVLFAREPQPAAQDVIRRTDIVDAVGHGGTAVAQGTSLPLFLAIELGGAPPPRR